jgi:hypothetical protein
MSKQQMPLWRIVAVINFPKQLVPEAPPPSGGMPKTIKLVSRIPDEANLEVDGISVRLKPWTGTSIPALASRKLEEPAALVFFLATEDPEIAYYDKLWHLLEDLLDSLSFQLQTAIEVFRLEALDVTPPVAVGMKRYFTPIEYYSGKFLASDIFSSIKPSLYPNLAKGLESARSKSRAALRWYVKGMAARNAVDKFISFWIALEMLRSESGVSVSAPYIARCGCEITECPKCGKPTAKEVLGKSIIKFLVDETGTKEDTAEKLWEFRQILHGRGDLTHGAIPQMAEDTREAVVIALKKALGWSSNEPPFVPPPMGIRSFRPGIDWSSLKVVDDNDVALGLPDENFEIK